MSGRPRPFPDVVDRRTDGQRRSDEERLHGPAGKGTRAQRLEPVAFQRVDGVLEQVTARRAPAGAGLSPIRIDGGVPFEPHPTTAGRTTLVVAGESIRRRRPDDLGEAPPAEIVAPPGAGGPEPVSEPPGGWRGPTGGHGDTDGADHELEEASPELAARLLRVAGGVVVAPPGPPPGPPPPDNPPQLGLPGIPAPEPEVTAVLVPVLHMAGRATPSVAAAGGGGASNDVIIKSPGGAAPTAVAQTGTAPRTPAGSVVVAIIDTGITDEVRSDGWLADLDHTRQLDRLDAFPIASPPDDPQDGDGFLDLGAGHGTFVAGIIRQVDPLAQIRVYRAMDSDGFGSELAVAAAMVRAAREGAHVINLSLGSESVDGQPPVVFETALDIIDQLSAGRDRPVIVAAAGNSGTDVPVWPAASKRVLAVAALTPDGAGAPWSSRGSWVDVSTIGQGIVSTYVAGTEDPDFVASPDTFGPSAWAMWSGTSFAAPQIAAAIARTCREQGLSPQAAADRLLAQAEPATPDFGGGLEFLPGT